MPEEKTTIHGHIVSYETESDNGVRYLMYRLNNLEAKVFFDEAYNKGYAFFQDNLRHKYKLIHHGGEYQLIRA